jgi:signal peptidase II
VRLNLNDFENQAKFNYLAITSFFAVIILDQLAKKIVILAHFSFAKNYGFSYGIFPGQFNSLAVILILFASILVFRNEIKKNRLGYLAFGLILGGGASNLIDRATHGYIVDYINLGIFSPLLPAVNLADIAVTFGVIGLIWVILQKPKAYLK